MRALFWGFLCDKPVDSYMCWQEQGGQGAGEDAVGGRSRAEHKTERALAQGISWV